MPVAVSPRLLLLLFYNLVVILLVLVDVAFGLFVYSWLCLLFVYHLHVFVLCALLWFPIFCFVCVVLLACAFPVFCLFVSHWFCHVVSQLFVLFVCLVFADAICLFSWGCV